LGSFLAEFWFRNLWHQDGRRWRSLLVRGSHRKPGWNLPVTANVVCEKNLSERFPVAKAFRQKDVGQKDGARDFFAHHLFAKDKSSGIRPEPTDVLPECGGTKLAHILCAVGNTVLTARD